MAKQTFLNLPKLKQEQIREIAEGEFAKHPYSQASLSRIVARAGIAKGSIYQYFENKLGLYHWLIEETAKKKLSYIKQETPEPGHFLTWLENAIFGGFRFAIEHPRSAQLGLRLQNETDPQIAKVARKLRQIGIDYMERLVQEAQLHGELRDELDPRILALLITATQNSILEALCAMAGVDTFELLFDNDVAATLKEEEIFTLVHQLMELIRKGAASLDGPHPVKNVSSQHLDIHKIIDRAFEEGENDE